MTQGGWSNQDVTRVVIIEGGAFTGLFFYAPSLGAGNLVGSWTVAAGTDPYGNSYPAGLTIRKGVSEININAAASGLVNQTFITGNPGIAFSAFLEGATQGAGAAEWDKLVFSSALNTTNTDQTLLAFFSSSTDASQRAEILMQYVNTPLGITETYFTLGYFGVSIPAGVVNAVQPTTGTSGSNPAVAETWHSASSLLSALWTEAAVSNPLRYRVEGVGTGRQVRLDGAVMTTGAGPWPANGTIFTLPTGYVPGLNHHFVNRSDIDVTAGMDTVNVLSTGAVRNGQAFTAAGQSLFFDGMTFPLD